MLSLNGWLTFVRVEQCQILLHNARLHYRNDPTQSGIKREDYFACERCAVTSAYVGQVYCLMAGIHLIYCYSVLVLTHACEMRLKRPHYVF